MNQLFGLALQVFGIVLLFVMIIASMFASNLSRAEIQRWLRPIGFLGRLVTYAAMFWALYVNAPKDISNTPLGSLTFSEIFSTVVFMGIAGSLVRALFTPSQHEATKDLWGWWSITILACVVILALYRYGMVLGASR
jgi:hypothetical protein